METPDDSFLQIFQFVDDDSKPGRTISSTRIGDITMARVTIEPGHTIGNHYHAQTRMMIYVGSGRVKGVFEDIKTKQRKEIIMTAAKEVVHSVENVAHAFTNLGDKPAVLVVFSNKPLRSKDSFRYSLVDIS